MKKARAVNLTLVGVADDAFRDVPIIATDLIT